MGINVLGVSSGLTSRACSVRTDGDPPRHLGRGWWLEENLAGASRGWNILILHLDADDPGLFILWKSRKLHSYVHFLIFITLQWSLKNTDAWALLYNKMKIYRDGAQLLRVCLKSFPGDTDRQPELRITDKELYTHMHTLYPHPPRVSHFSAEYFVTQCNVLTRALDR